MFLCTSIKNGPASRSVWIRALTVPMTAVQTCGEACRLCGGATKPLFSRIVMDRYEARYTECAGCGSLQTESPSWLSEAYQGPLASADTGAAQRTLYCQMAVYWLYRILGLPRTAILLDFGGGEGLLVRLLRDLRMVSFLEDRYGRGAFSGPFRYDGATPPSVITSFEVWEHLLECQSTIDTLFARRPNAMFISTEIYTGQSQDWWYLGAESGQHIFFYSRKAMEMIAARHGYYVHIFKNAYVLFTGSPMASWRRLAMRIVLSHKLRRPLMAFMSFVAEIP